MEPGRVSRADHVRKDWITKFKGQFDQGWDKLREETVRAAEEE
jgi:arylsulfatase